MKDLFFVAAQVEEYLRSKNWQFCFIGGIALQRWGEPRLTIDIDLTLLTGLGNEESFIQDLLKQYAGRRPDAADFALRYRVVLLQSDAVGIDVALGALPFEENSIRRASSFAFLPGVELRTCSAEDLVVMKAFADRGRDWEDVRGILIRQGAKLNWVQIRDELSPLCELKEAPHILPRLDVLRREVGGAGAR